MRLKTQIERELINDYNNIQTSGSYVTRKDCDEAEVSKAQCLCNRGLPLLSQG